MDAVHAAATVLFLWFGAEPMLEKLDRIKTKYVDGEYLDDMMHGSWIMFYHSGVVASNAVFDRGTGIQKGYSDDGGRLMTLIHYKNNKKDGEEQHYSPDGKIMETLLWEDGEYVGKK